jgi:hypothetical protein
MNQIKLIDGDYSVSEAADVLFSVISDKIRFHNIQMLSIRERFDGDTSHSEERLAELNEAKEKIAEILKVAREQGADLEIYSSIQIKLKPTLKS